MASNSKAILDYALFQLTPTRTRCELLVFCGGANQKIASGLFEPFVSHLKFVRDEISKGGYSIKLLPPSNSAFWFTRATFERFVRFVSTPAILERFVSLENEILQIESSFQANALSMSNATPDEGIVPQNNGNTRRLSDSAKLNDVLEGVEIKEEESSKVSLHRLLESRIALLRKEQAMAYSRGLVAGFEIDSIDDLIYFANAFGAIRLREACINFKELWKKKHADDLWIKEVAAMQSSLPPALSLSGSSGIILANDITANDQNSVASGDGNVLSETSNSTSNKKEDVNLATPDQKSSQTANVHMPMPWPYNVPPYMYNLSQMPSYQGYPMNNMQTVPPYLLQNLQWSSDPGVNQKPSSTKKDKSHKKRADEYEEDQQSESSDADSGSESDSDKQNYSSHSSKDDVKRRKNRRKSSGTVVIRNINYITPKRRNGNEDGGSDESLEDDDVIDEQMIKQKVGVALESLHKVHKGEKHANGKKAAAGHKVTKSSDATEEDLTENLSDASQGGNNNENWSAFQNLLKIDEGTGIDGPERMKSIDAQDEHFTVRNSEETMPYAASSTPNLDFNEVLKNPKVPNDSFIVTRRDGGNEGGSKLDEYVDNCGPVTKSRDNVGEEIVLSHRSKEPGNKHGDPLSTFAADSLQTKGRTSDDWFILENLEKMRSPDPAIVSAAFDGDFTSPVNGHSHSEKRSERTLIDDSFMIQGQLVDNDLSGSQWKRDLSMVADLTVANKPESDAASSNEKRALSKNQEPNDLFVVLQRDSGFDSVEGSRMKFTQLLRYFLKFVVAAVWVVVLPICYSSSLVNPSGLIKFVTSWAGDWGPQSLYTYVVVLYMCPNIVGTILFFIPPLRRKLERSNMRILTILMWWAQPKLYVGRGMHENMFSLLKYTLFWIMLLISKLAFSYYVEILPLIGPTKLIMGMSINNYQWHEFFPENETHNICIVIAIWAPIILVYFMDTQIWYAIYATLFGGIIGAFSHLGEIRTLGMLRSRFQSVPVAFSQRFWTGRDRKTKQEESDETYERNNIAYFSQVWNEFINSMREEDLISNRDRDLLLVPYTASYVSVIQWPPFLLASKIPIAVDMAKDYKKETDDDLFRKIKSDGYMYSAVVECYETLREIILHLLLEEEDKLVVSSICDKVEQCIREETFVKEFNMTGLPSLSEKLEKFLTLLRSEDGKLESQIVNVLQDIVEIIIQDVMVDGHLFLQTPQQYHLERGQRFVNVDTSFTHNRAVMEKVIRLHLLLTVKESAINVPQNIEARRRITFFANSLFMNMPKAPKVRDMLSFSVLTPYFKEDVLYSDEELNKENEDGISILFYLTKIYPDEWANFHERLKSEDSEEEKEELMRQWASYRGQTLYRTVRGMMYYWHALILQCFIESAGDNALSEGYRTMYSYDTNKKLLEEAQAMADLKFTYVVSCQVYGSQKKSKNPRDRSCYNNILNLMLTNTALRVAYIDETEETKDGKSQKVYYSVLVKGGDKYDEEIYRIKLPGPPTEIGEGKPENQNHAIIFTRGEALQTIDMNQDNYYEEAFKMRNVLEEFRKRRTGRRKPTILGIREHIFTGSVSSLAWFMSNQETSFVTIGQRILANPLRVRFHYGHPDIFDRMFHITRGGLSKASKVINLSEDIFAGFNSTLRQGFITHHEYIQVGKGRDVGMNQISLFEAKVANGNGEQSLSRDVYRLGRRFDFYRMLSFYFTTVGFYFSSMITVLTVYVFLYGRLYMVLSGVEKEILQSPNIHQSKALEEALATQSVVQLGLLLVLPMVMEIGLEKGFRTALGDFIIMQLQLASVFFTFQLGTKAHYYGRTLLHGGSKYRPTGRGFVVFHAKFAENYRMYSRSHFVKGLEILILLIVYEVYGESYRSSHLYLFITISMWFLATSWLFAPFLFNPSGFDWQKTVDDWSDWKRWMGNRGGIGISADKSWESWWDEENEHMKHSNIRGKILEIILAFRFFMYQYGIVYHMDITHHNKELLVFGLSWAVLIIILIVLKMVSMGRRRFGTDFQLMFRILKALLFLGFLSVMTVLFVVCGLTISDLFAAIIAFMPSGWAIILIAQACKVCLKGAKLWDSVKELSRAYEYVMGLIIFLPTAILSWFPFVSEFQTRLLFNQAFSRGLQISMILAGKKDTYKSD